MMNLVLRLFTESASKRHESWNGFDTDADSKIHLSEDLLFCGLGIWALLFLSLLLIVFDFFCLCAPRVTQLFILSFRYLHVNFSNVQVVMFIFLYIKHQFYFNISIQHRVRVRDHFCLCFPHHHDGAVKGDADYSKLPRERKRSTNDE